MVECVGWLVGWICWLGECVGCMRALLVEYPLKG